MKDKIFITSMIILIVLAISIVVYGVYCGIIQANDMLDCQDSCVRSGYNTGEIDSDSGFDLEYECYCKTINITRTKLSDVLVALSESGGKDVR